MKEKSLRPTKPVLLAADALPFFNAHFCRLLGKTLQIKWKYARQGNGKYIDYLAQFYNQANNTFWEAVEDDKWASIRELMVELADLRPEDTVLDLATGVGYQAAAFSAKGHHATGLDYFFQRAQMAKKRQTQALLTWTTADAARLPFAENAFDAISVSLALHDLPLSVMNDVLVEIYRVARQRVVIVEPHMPVNPIFKFVYLGLATLFDESLWIKDYLQCDLLALLAKARLRVLTKQPCFHQILAIYVCEPVKGVLQHIE